ncbi:hypothetical protein K488DRAFT_78797 [Vararia minispora EC-137]|uniref:Uncharacterized protein n=1 Tax=Vararia minispora EC-137 TaxID=1314806 RepID=A0ACB8QK02_9AGAM|nr:hypothetical protein K488DRAFT_78797 [Vararia minispora EC-137]
MPVLKRIAQLSTFSAVAGAGIWKYYTKDTVFVPYTQLRAERDLPSLGTYNPGHNPPALVDKAVRRVPLSQLRTTDVGTLTRGFCAGVWSGPGFEMQKNRLASQGRMLEGRDAHLWGKDELAGSEYPVGTRIADHFEVVERTPNKVVVRCGDTPHKEGPRPSDGLFSMEVHKEDGYATFAMKSIFFNSTPEGSTPAQLPWWFPFAHREYAKLWMETSVRRLMK